MRLYVSTEPPAIWKAVRVLHGESGAVRIVADDDEPVTARCDVHARTDVSMVVCAEPITRHAGRCTVDPDRQIVAVPENKLSCVKVFVLNLWHLRSCVIDI